MDEQMYKDAEKALDDLIESCGIPKGHPLGFIIGMVMLI